MNLREQELFYAELDGKHGALDCEKDNGTFYMSMMMRNGNNREYLSKFITSYREMMEKIENEQCENSSLHLSTY